MSRATGQPNGRPRATARLTALHGGRERPTGPTYPPGPAEPPEYLQLSEPAAAFWREHAPELIRVGLLTRVDGPLFGEMCECYAILQASRAKLAAEGQIVQGQRGPQRHPSMLVYTTALTIFHSLASRFGFNPEARSRLAGIGPKDDEFDDLISR